MYGPAIEELRKPLFIQIISIDINVLIIKREFSNIYLSWEIINLLYNNIHTFYEKKCVFQNKNTQENDTVLHVCTSL